MNASLEVINCSDVPLLLEFQFQLLQEHINGLYNASPSNAIRSCAIAHSDAPWLYCFPLLIAALCVLR